jgi:phage I-like protein
MQIVHAARLDELSKLDASALPTEFRLFALGKNATSKGTFVLDEAGLASVMAAYAEHGVDLSLDYEHQAFADNGKPAPAAGWFKPEARADGLWAVNVRWTPPATEMLRNKEYRYFSPAFQVDKQMRITRLLNVALTNLPATKNQEALIAARDGQAQEIRMSNALTTILGLKDDAPEAQLSERVYQLADAERQLLDITGKPSVGEALAMVIAAKAATDEAEKLRAEVAKWQEHAAREEADAKEKAISVRIQAAVLDRRVSEKDDETITKLRRLGAIGIEHMELAISMLRPAPVRLYAPPVRESGTAAQLKAIEDYRAKNPSATQGEAYVACATANPGLFSNVTEEA